MITEVSHNLAKPKALGQWPYDSTTSNISACNSFLFFHKGVPVNRALFVLLVLSAFPIYPQDVTTAITGGNLVNTNGAAPLENAIILMNGNRITQVGPGTEVEIPPEVEVISAKGKWIIPGLINAHLMKL